MEPMTWAFIGTVVGALASIATTLITNIGSYSISKKQKEYEREEATRLLQRSALLEIQKEVQQHLAACNNIANQLRSTPKGEVIGYISTENLEKFSSSASKTRLLAHQIIDDEARESVLLFLDLAEKLLLVGQDKINGCIFKYMEKYKETNVLLGNTLRSTY